MINKIIMRTKREMSSLSKTRSREEMHQNVLEAIERGGHFLDHPIMTAWGGSKREFNTVASISHRSRLTYVFTQGILADLETSGVIVYTPHAGGGNNVFHEKGEFWMTTKGLQYLSKLRRLHRMLC